MRSVREASAFRKDFKRESKGVYRYVLKEEFWDIVAALASDVPLSPKYRDHILAGEWEGCGECHVKPDLLLIYLKDDDANALHLLRLGSHSELFGT